jgi:hypothetical protein
VVLLIFVLLCLFLLLLVFFVRVVCGWLCFLLCFVFWVWFGLFVVVVVEQLQQALVWLGVVGNLLCMWMFKSEVCGVFVGVGFVLDFLGRFEFG